MIYKTKQEVIAFINDLKGYRGYVQFSHRQINKEKDIFFTSHPIVQDEDGFVYEAHFCNETYSISIKQINAEWLISKTDISSIQDSELQIYKSDITGWNNDIKMAQVWEEITDPLCEDMQVKKLKKVVFAGFETGEIK